MYNVTHCIQCFSKQELAWINAEGGSAPPPRFFPFPELVWLSLRLITEDKETSSMYLHILYSQKRWQELYLAVGLQITIANILADLNLVVW